jgi:benzil reductase ((S)-benzoin forming)
MDKRLAIITGTSSGIGRALAGRLSSAGWMVIGIARRPVEETSPAYRHIQCDLADLDALTGNLLPELEQVITGQPWQRLALINNAAVTGQLKDVSQLDGRVLHASLAVNTTAPVVLMGLVTRLCPSGTQLRIVNLSSGLAYYPMPGVTDYCTSKAALLMAGRVLACEQEAAEANNTAVLSYSPGIVDTEMQQVLRSSPESTFSSTHVFRRMHSEGSLVAATDVLQPIVDFLDRDDVSGFTEARFGEE